MTASNWQREHDELKRLIDSARNDITKMTACERKGDRESFITYKSNARTKITSVANRLPTIARQLQSSQNNPSSIGITEGEWLRRRKSLKTLGNDYNNCKTLFSKPAERYAQYGHNYKGGRDVPMETQETLNMSNDAIKDMHMQRQIVQDENLEELLQGVKRVHVITEDLVIEVDRQNKVIEDIDYEMDRADHKLNTNIKRVTFLNRKAKDKGCCCLMLILFVIIIALLIWIMG